MVGTVMSPGREPIVEPRMVPNAGARKIERSTVSRHRPDLRRGKYNHTFDAKALLHLALGAFQAAG
jgi:hypothetical protein